ncbi:MAG: GTPase ObgE [Corallococcus sp.]|nr:GTPase ObgE [Corallococcus sp.]MCM1359303.1 GTPase ObgE [Corallococcus sp.]MCM1394886.1 GTPase ObgE [Corallococcus sp.]
MFIDKVKIFVKAGNGGDGSASLHTEKYVPNGGPDGGDGGRGGDIVFVATTAENTLNEFHFQKHFRAENGQNGGKKNCYGKSGQDLEVKVPVGTVVKTVDGDVVADMFADGQREIIAKGGRGGRGNRHFATSKRRSPSFAEHGVKTQEHEVVLELKTIADVGLVGFPNVGKSTLLSVVSSAKPKIANYHFTTLAPNLGVVSYYDSTFVMADIPGLIEGASEGAGLGHSFLRHIERTRLLVHVLDISGSENRNPLDDFELINNEIYSYDENLKDLPMIVVANKMDMPSAEENLQAFTKKYGKKYKIVPMTTIIHEGVTELLSEIIDELSSLPPLEPLHYVPVSLDKEESDDFEIEKLDEDVFEVVGGLVSILNRKVNLDDYDSFNYFQRTMRDRGVIAALRKAGAVDGSTVIVGDIEFEFVD